MACSFQFEVCVCGRRAGRKYDTRATVETGQVKFLEPPQVRDGAERRRSTRLPLSFPIEVTWVTDAGGRRSYLLGRTKDVCPNGVCFWIPRPLSLGQKLNLNMEAPLETRPQWGLRLQCEAEVVRVERAAREEDGYQVAARVIEFDTPVVVPTNPPWPA